MAARARTRNRASRRRGGQEYPVDLRVYGLANRVKGGLTPAPKDPSQEQANGNIGSLCMLQTSQPETEGTYAVSTHMFAQVVSWDPVKRKFGVQPYDAYGKKQGKALLEDARFISFLPGIGDKIQVLNTHNTGHKDASIANYFMASNMCSLDYVDDPKNPAASAAKKPAASAAKKTAAKKTSAKKVSSKKNSNKPAAKKPAAAAAVAAAAAAKQSAKQSATKKTAAKKTATKKTAAKKASSKKNSSNKASSKKPPAAAAAPAPAPAVVSKRKPPLGKQPFANGYVVDTFDDWAITDVKCVDLYVRWKDNSLHRSWESLSDCLLAAPAKVKQYVVKQKRSELTAVWNCLKQLQTKTPPSKRKRKRKARSTSSKKKTKTVSSNKKTTSKKRRNSNKTSNTNKKRKKLDFDSVTGASDSGATGTSAGPNPFNLQEVLASYRMRRGR